VETTFQTIEPGATVVAPAEAYRLTTPPGTRIDLTDVALQSLEASMANLDRSAVARMSAKRASFRFSAIGAAVTRSFDATWTSVGAAIAAKFDAKTIVTQWLVGGVDNANTIFAFAVVSPNVNGNVRAVVGFWGALGLSVGIGVMTMLARWMRLRTHRA
jgi:hypothetical protein